MLTGMRHLSPIDLRNASTPLAFPMIAGAESALALGIV
jgi:hypothetical protein